MKTNLSMPFNRLIPTVILLVLMAGGLTAQDIISPQPAAEAAVEKSIPVTPTFPFEPVPGLVSREDDIRAGLLYDTQTGKIVWQKDMFYAYPIASLTKMMVALLAVLIPKCCSSLRRGKLMGGKVAIGS